MFTTAVRQTLHLLSPRWMKSTTCLSQITLRNVATSVDRKLHQTLERFH